MGFCSRTNQKRILEIYVSLYVTAIVFFLCSHENEKIWKKHDQQIRTHLHLQNFKSINAKSQLVKIPNTVTDKTSQKREKDVEIGKRKINQSISTDRKKNEATEGRVLDEFCRRVLSTRVAQSNVLIVSPDVLEEIITKKEEGNDYADRTSALIAGNVVIRQALQNGHTTYMLPPSTNLKKWWTQSSDANHLNKPTWFLMTYILGGDNGSIDEILHPSRAMDFLSDATLTYIVIGVHSKMNQSSGVTSMTGLTAVQTLLDFNYKIQLLASSQFGEPGFHPNHLFKNTEDVNLFLSFGARMSQNERFEALLFATQGLDLAIPSRLSYIDLNNVSQCIQGNRLKLTGRCDSKINWGALKQNIFLQCPKHHRDLDIKLDRKSPTGVRIKLNQEEIVYEKGEDIDLWLGHKDASSAEAACVRVITSDSKLPKVSCNTRIVKQPLPKLTPITISTKIKPKYNVLSILIDPLSRSQLQRSLPYTYALLHKLGFAHFKKYTAVGDNSGPNQAALFTGSPLLGGREGIRSSDTHNVTDKSVWLWDELASDGYVTLKAEDVCIQNSNMVQSIKPNTTHGSQLYQMFCFDFDRPNCLGKNLASTHLIRYAQQFMNSYGSTTTGNRFQPWAAFLSFVDSHEDTLTLISYLDEMLFWFIQSIDLSNTLVVFSSDHGLHYGPSFLSNGERERAEPILYIHTPNNDQLKHLKRNAEFWTTPFDVHQTVKDIILQQMSSSSTAIGTSLLNYLQDTRKDCYQTPGIPKRFCSILTPIQNISAKEIKSCTFLQEPPSVLSFYADIPRKNRPSWPICKKKEFLFNTKHSKCYCAKNCLHETLCVRECKTSRPNDLLQDPLSLRACRTKKKPYQFQFDITINIKTKKKLEKRHIEKKFQWTSKPQDLETMPNILFIEIDSLSHSAALRHIPKTISVLQSHQMINDQSKGVHCPTGFCAAMFNKSSVIGQNSISNQLAALSGCTDRNLTGVDSYLRPSLTSGRFKNIFQTWCPKSVNNTWLFEIARDLGYVSFFGEEFCYHNSQYIVQDNAFELNVDYNLNELFCRLAKTFLKYENSRDQPWTIEYDTSKRPDPCVDGRSKQEFAFEYIRNIWNAYPKTPKFAYINSLAAHDYSVDLAYQALGVEAYDDYLSKFLEEILQRPDAQNTIIVLRSDHGLQGGPSPIDFSFQVEHMRPFFNLIVPEKLKLHGLSLDNLFANQDKLVTGYDLYNTLRAALTPRLKDGKCPIENNENYHNGVPEWSLNLLEDTVPNDRTCDDAKIPVEFCPCMEERTDLMPYFYVGQTEKLHQMKNVDLRFIDKTQSFEPIELPVSWENL